MDADRIRKILERVIDSASPPQSLEHQDGLIRGLLWALTGEDPGRCPTTDMARVFTLAGIPFTRRADGMLEYGWLPWKAEADAIEADRWVVLRMAWNYKSGQFDENPRTRNRILYPTRSAAEGRAMTLNMTGAT